jgi:hypothetical protein
VGSVPREDFGITWELCISRVTQLTLLEDAMDFFHNTHVMRMHRLADWKASRCVGFSLFFRGAQGMGASCSLTCI